ncbi:MAG: hypothetical protein U5L45_01160 [Saprospiraceae bacterium]|nr:hypothetical protein [Saprospiraceae bacterium]
MVHFSGFARKMNHFPLFSRAKRAQLLMPTELLLISVLVTAHNISPLHKIQSFRHGRITKKQPTSRQDIRIYRDLSASRIRLGGLAR